MQRAVRTARAALRIVLVSAWVASSWAAEPASGAWPKGAAGAVSLSYDDSVPVHHEKVAPLLERHGLRGTFYLTIREVRDAAAWKVVASRGHELGNHSLFHPCRRDPNRAAWLAAHYDLKEYTAARFRDELAVANKFLDVLDGGRPRTYGNVCTDLTIGNGASEQPMDPILAELFVAARGNITGRPVNPSSPQLMRLGHYDGDAKTFEQLRAEILAGTAQGGWVIYMFHGVGKGTHALYIDDAEHRKLVEWLGAQSGKLWTAPVVEVAQHLKSRPR